MKTKALIKMYTIDELRELVEEYIEKNKCSRCGSELTDAEIRYTKGTITLLVGKKIHRVGVRIKCPRCSHIISENEVIRWAYLRKSRFADQLLGS